MKDKVGRGSQSCGDSAYCCSDTGVALARERERERERATVGSDRLNAPTLGTPSHEFHRLCGTPHPNILHVHVVALHMLHTLN